MSKKSIVKNEDKLHEFCEQVEPTDELTKEIINELTKKLKTNKSCLVLAAPQIGYNKRIICVKYSNNEIIPYINPQLLQDYDFHLVRETDVCFGDQQFLNLRPEKTRMSYYDLTGKKQETIFRGTVAELFNRALNYLNGITPRSFGLELDEDYDKLTDEEKIEIHTIYINTLNEAAKLAMEEAEADPAAKKTLDAIEFMKSVQRGDTTLDIKTFIKENAIIEEEAVKTAA